MSKQHGQNHELSIQQQKQQRQQQQDSGASVRLHNVTKDTGLRTIAPSVPSGQYAPFPRSNKDLLKPLTTQQLDQSDNVPDTTEPECRQRFNVQRITGHGGSTISSGTRGGSTISSVTRGGSTISGGTRSTCGVSGMALTQFLSTIYAWAEAMKLQCNGK